jgi:hypothetical protein
MLLLFLFSPLFPFLFNPLFPFLFNQLFPFLFILIFYRFMGKRKKCWWWRRVGAELAQI